MWESRVLCEISKALWKPFCGFHGAAICIAIFGIAGPLQPLRDSRTNIHVAGCARHMVLLRRVLGAQVNLEFGAPAFGSALEHVRVVQKPIEQRRDRGGVPEQFAPIVDWAV